MCVHADKHIFICKKQNGVSIYQYMCNKSVIPSFLFPLAFFALFSAFSYLKLLESITNNKFLEVSSIQGVSE